MSRLSKLASSALAAAKVAANPNSSPAGFLAANHVVARHITSLAHDEIPKFREEQIKKSHDEFCRKYGASSIPELSETNFNRLQEELGVLSDDECKLATFLVTELSARHKTTHLDLIKREGAMLSVGVRHGLGRILHNRNVKEGAGENNVFFALGVGDHQIPTFVSKGRDIIDMRLAPILTSYPEMLRGFFVSGDLRSYDLRRVTSPVCFGDTKVQIIHEANFVKAYVCEAESRSRRVLRVPMLDEVFHEKQIPEAIALQFIRYLRFIDPRYCEYFLHKISDEKIEYGQRLQSLSAAMSLIMPSSIYPEGKQPGFLLLDQQNSHVSFVTERASPHREETMEIIKLARDKTLPDRKIMTENLLKAGASIVGYKNINPLAEAVHRGDEEMVDILLSLRSADLRDPMITRFAAINGISDHASGLSMIQDACLQGNHKILQKLIDAGARINGVDNEQLSSIAAAANLQTFLTLVANGIDAKFEASCGKTPLMSFAERGDFDGVKFLIEKGADLNSRYRFNDDVFNKKYSSEFNGYTALHFLMSVKDDEQRMMLLQYLLEHGADQTIAADNGKTPYLLALECGYSREAEILKKFEIDTAVKVTEAKRVALSASKSK